MAATPPERRALRHSVASSVPRPAGVVSMKQASLEGVVRGSATIVTLANRNLSGDSGELAYRYRRAMVPLAIASYPALLFLIAVAFLPGVLLPNRTSGVLSAIMGMALVAAALVSGWRWLLRTKGRTDASKDAEVALSRALDPIRLQRSFGSAVVYCQDDFWRPAVMSALRRANAVIVDASAWSESLAWEVEQAVSQLGPQKLVVLYPADAATSPELLALRRAARSASVLSTSDLPGPRTAWGETRWSRDRRSELRKAVFAAIAAPPSHSGNSRTS